MECAEEVGNAENSEENVHDQNSIALHNDWEELPRNSGQREMEEAGVQENNVNTKED